MKAVITPTTLSGRVEAIPSKSSTHRILICCALSDAESEFVLRKSNADIEATARCLRALGAEIINSNGIIHVKPMQTVPHMPLLDCGESGSTLRFLLPVAAAKAQNVSFTGCGRLPSRPMSELINVIKCHGVQFNSNTLPFSTSGRLLGGKYDIAGNVSSQYISGLLLALPLISSDSSINLTSKLESASYVGITLNVLKKFGIDIKDCDGYYINAQQKYKTPKKIEIDTDWSNSAFFLAAGAICGDTQVSGLDPNSPQGDKKIIELLKSFGATVSKDFTVSPGTLIGFDIDISDIPDLLPILAITAALSNGKSVFKNTSRLRLKESDRLASTLAMLQALGGKAEISGDSFTVYGTGLTGGTVESFNDHRIVMAAAIAACACKKQVIINGCEAVNKSYPSFFDDYKKLGGIVNVL